MFILGAIVAYFALGIIYILAEIFSRYASNLMFCILCFWFKPIEIIIRRIYRAYFKRRREIGNDKRNGKS